MVNSVEKLSGQTILITGASGFLGSHLVRHLCHNGAEVHAVSRSFHTSDISCLRWWHGDMEDIKFVQNLFHSIKPDLIFHLSGLVTAVPNLEFILPTFHSLLTSTINLLTIAAEIGCSRIVLIASLEEPEQDRPEVVPSSPYAIAKFASSTYGRMFHRLYQTPVVLVRPFMTYGPGQNVYKIVPSVILSLLQGQAPKLSSGKRQVDWIYIDDVIAGLLAATQVPNVEGCTFDLGSGELVPIHAVVSQLVNLVNPQIQPLFGALPERPMERIRVADMAYTYDKLGWQPSISLKKGLELTVNWYTKHQQEIRYTS
ncbi:NAD-dependent epimerase/dehydratase family protein [Nostoc sp.]|uniref:NAD-dependent epimerase/dehydratase family protein n=1 Tax=Nostoc sp. TaxID=1180 RepID=UPI002FFC00B1